MKDARETFGPAMRSNSLSRGVEEGPDESDDVRLDIVIGTAHDELGYASGPNTVVSREVPLDDFDRFGGTRIVQYRTQGLGNIGRTGCEVANHIEEVIRILVFTTGMKSQGFKDHICAWISDGARPPTTTTSSDKSPSFVAT
jgi:hypothetical protein